MRRRDSVLIYQDRLGAPSEAQFLRRQYIGFERLTPVWACWGTDQGLPDVGATPIILGWPGPLGAWDRFRFKQLGVLPAQPDLRVLGVRVVHAQFGRGGALALPIARALGVPLVVTFHGGDATKDKHYRRSLIPTVFQRRLAALQKEAALFLCVSEFVRQRLAARGFPPEKLKVLRLGVEIDTARATEPPVDPPTAVFVGRFVEKKGIAHLIEAARLTASQGSPVRFMLIGDGPLAGELRKRAAGLDNVSFTGWLPSKEVRRHMRRALVLCAPSVVARTGDADGLPTVVLEAMADGIPVIGSREAGIGEAVEDGKTGLLVASGSAQALADAIRTLVDRPELRRTLGAAARQVAQERFNAAVQSRHLERTLIEVAQAVTPRQSWKRNRP
jgi:glycosyltransferase involved in cell wall biosynthesis